MPRSAVSSSSNVELRDALEPEPLAELVPDERHRPPERRERCLAFRRLADDADPDLGMAQVRRRLDVGDRDEADPRVGDLAGQDRPDLLAQELVDPVGALRHRPLRQLASRRG